MSKLPYLKLFIGFLKLVLSIVHKLLFGLQQVLLFIVKRVKTMVVFVTYILYRGKLKLKKLLLEDDKQFRSQVVINFLTQYFGVLVFTFLAIFLIGYNFFTRNSVTYSLGNTNLLVDFMDPEDAVIRDQNSMVLDDVSNANNLLSIRSHVTNISDLDAGVGVEGLLFNLNDNVLIKPNLIASQNIRNYTNNITEYIVKVGDSLSSIANQFEISVDTILTENGLYSGAYLKPGDKLRILPITGISYKIKEGDTLARISTKFQTDNQKIIAFNRLINEKDIKSGQVLIIPGVQLANERKVYVALRYANKSWAGNIGGKLAYDMVWPVLSKKINQYFTWRHNGIDLHGRMGDPIFASAPGKVIKAGWIRGYGYQVLIQHPNNILTRYAHSSKLLVKNGDIVQRNQVIGLVGSTGRSTGPHVHYEIIRNGKRTNPLSYFKSR